MKRFLDVLISLLCLILLSPIFLLFMFLIWLQDYASPLYISSRVGRNGNNFPMVKLRSMIVNADISGVDSTAIDDERITRIGHFIRKYKLDELFQLWNVLCGHMSIVGPRPNVQRGVELYTEKERHLLDIRPGITDFASIVFYDEGDILYGSMDPDLRYNQIIRPWKSRLGLLYVEKQTLLLDLKIILLTAISIFSRQLALDGLQRTLNNLGADSLLINISSRKKPLQPYPPPGSKNALRI